MGKLGNLAANTKRKVDLVLEDREAEILLVGVSKLDALKPQISDPAAFAALIGAVHAATERNENVAALQQRIKALGDSGLKAAKMAAKLLA